VFCTPLPAVLAMTPAQGLFWFERAVEMLKTLRSARGG
jgi:hypothetical protein